MTFASGWINGGKYFGELHPKTESQYAHQRALAGLLPGYAGWMQSRAYDEQMANLRNRLGLSWSDIKSPWIADVSGHNAVQSAGMMVSKNLSRLYSDVPSKKPEESVRSRARKYGPWS